MCIRDRVEEHDNPVHNAGFLKAAAEVVGYIVGNAHGGKDDTELLTLFSSDVGLLYDLGSQLVVLHTGTGEDGPVSYTHLGYRSGPRAGSPHQYHG